MVFAVFNLLWQVLKFPAVGGFLVGGIISLTIVFVRHLLFVQMPPKYVRDNEKQKLEFVLPPSLRKSE